MKLRKLFMPPKDKKLAAAISIRSPTAFKNSIAKLSKGGITIQEKRALTLAKTRAKVQLKRKNLSKSERIEMRQIARTKLPKVSKR